jgi:adenylate cyclase
VAGGLIGLAAGVIVALAAVTPIVEKYEGQAADLSTRLFADPRRADPRIVAVVIDQRSLDAIAAPPDRGGLGHGWPWPRDYYAAVIDYLSGAGVRAIGIDLSFSEPSLFTTLGVADDDADLARAFIGRPVVQATMLTQETRASTLADRQWPDVLRSGRRSRPLAGISPRFNKITLPHELLLRAGDAVGWIGFEPDPDGVARTVRPAASYSPLGADRAVEILGFPLALAVEAGARVEMLPGRPAAERLVVDGRPIALDEWGRLVLHFHGGENAYRSFSFAKVLESAKRRLAGVPVKEAPPEDFKDKIVIVGATATGLLDLRATAVSAILPGYLMHATALDNLLHGDPLRRPGTNVRLAIIVLIAVVAGKLATSLRTFRSGTLAAAAAGVFYLGFALWAFWARQLWLDAVAPMAAVALAWAGGTGYLYVTEGRERRFLRDAFSRYLSPSVVEALVADPGRLALGGESRELTIMFADVAGFTTFSEGRTPHELVSLMNEYFTTLTDIIQRHGGTVDKFIGDAVMAFWNAPLEQPDHAVRASEAAREAIEAVARLAGEWAERGLPRIAIRVGLATGPALVGNVGSRSTFNYTAMGDTVNLASRLEGAAKVYGASNLVAGTTAERCGGVVPFRELDWLQVKGKTEPVAVYTLRMDGPVDGRDKDVASCYAEGLIAYRDARFREASRCFEAALAADLSDGPSREMLARCRELEITPPPPGWKGEHILTSK